MGLRREDDNQWQQSIAKIGKERAKTAGPRAGRVVFSF
jgi:hypothetical protein